MSSGAQTPESGCQLKFKLAFDRAFADLGRVRRRTDAIARVSPFALQPHVDQPGR